MCSISLRATEAVRCKEKGPWTWSVLSIRGTASLKPRSAAATSRRSIDFSVRRARLALRAPGQGDKHVFQLGSVGRTSSPSRPRSAGERSASTRAWMAWPKIVAWRTPGGSRSRSSSAAVSGLMISRRRVPGGVTPGKCFSSSRRADGQQVGQVDVADARAALGLVHVVRRDHQRDALGGKAKQQVPESRRATGSMPAVGSSRKTSRGRCSRAQASASRCFQPPDSRPRTPVQVRPRPVCATSSAWRVRASAADRP